jgi:hypothetical protein
VRTGPFGRKLWHPLPLGAVLLLLLNDHLLKGSGLLPGVLTGKLSDVAGLFFFPLLLEALLEQALPRARRLPEIAVAATAAAFAAVKTLAPVNRWASLFGTLVLDPTDLWALVALAPSWRWMRRARSAGPRWGRLGAVSLAAVATLATSRPRMERVYPLWAVTAEPEHTADCAALEAWVSKSGKEGVGVTVALSTASQSCDVTWESAALQLAGSAVAAPLPPPARLGTAPAYQYLPFAFDNEAAWNRGNNAATLRFQLQVNGAPQEWSVALAQTQEGWHRVGERWRGYAPLHIPDDGGTTEGGSGQ